MSHVTGHARLKLYVWSGAGVLEQYGTGYAFALAETVGQAREMLLSQIQTRYDWIDWTSEDQDDVVWQRGKVGFLDKSPAVYDAPVAFAIEGSS